MFRSSVKCDTTFRTISAMLGIILIAINSGCASSQVTKSDNATAPTQASRALPPSSGNIQKPASAPDMFEFGPDNMIHAEGVPTTPPDAEGLFLRRADNSVFIGTGQIKVSFATAPGAGASQSDASPAAEHDGPVVEVVLNHNTKILKDVTQLDMKSMTNGSKVQQQVEILDSVDALANKVSRVDILLVWGNRSGDRIVAQTVLVSSPPNPAP